MVDGHLGSSVTPNVRTWLRWVAANIVQVNESARTFLLHPDTRKSIFKGQSNQSDSVRTFNGNIDRAARCVRSCGLFLCFNGVQLVTVSRSHLHAFTVLVPQGLETGHEVGVHSVLLRVFASELFGFEVGVLSPVYHLPCPLYALVLRCLLACLVCRPSLTRVRLR
jgi:hypothetical protein